MHRTKIGYLVISIYLIMSSLLFWIIDNPYNILSTGIGDLRPFFELSPWLLALLIPAIGMKSFTDEIQNQTFEILFSKPISISELVLGKFFSLLILIYVTLIPLLIYFFAIKFLIVSNDSFEWMSHLSGLLGIFLTGLVFSSITLCVSILLKNSILVFIISFVICCFHYYAWFYLAQLSSNTELYDTLNSFGIIDHYIGISKGILKISDILYYLFTILLFLYLCTLFIERLKFQK